MTDRAQFLGLAINKAFWGRSFLELLQDLFTTEEAAHVHHFLTAAWIYLSELISRNSQCEGLVALLSDAPDVRWWIRVAGILTGRIEVLRLHRGLIAAYHHQISGSVIYSSANAIPFLLHLNRRCFPGTKCSGRSKKSVARVPSENLHNFTSIRSAVVLWQRGDHKSRKQIRIRRWKAPLRAACATRPATWPRAAPHRASIRYLRPTPPLFSWQRRIHLHLALLSTQSALLQVQSPASRSARDKRTLEIRRWNWRRNFTTTNTWLENDDRRSRKACSWQKDRYWRLTRLQIRQ